MICTYLSGHKAGEVLDVEDDGCARYWAVWVEHGCNNSDEDGCPNLDDNDIECPLKENHISDIQEWAVFHLALSRENRYTKVRQMMQEDEGQ